MKKLLLVVALLLAASFALAISPFVGEWQCGTDHYWISENYIRGIVDGVPYESEYIYTDSVLVVREMAWAYLVVDPDHIALVGFVRQPDGSVAPMLWKVSRITWQDWGA